MNLGDIKNMTPADLQGFLDELVSHDSISVAKETIRQWIEEKIYVDEAIDRFVWFYKKRKAGMLYLLGSILIKKEDPDDICTLLDIFDVLTAFKKGERVDVIYAHLAQEIYYRMIDPFKENKMTDYMSLSAELINKLDTHGALVVIEKTYLEFFDQDKELKKSMATIELWSSQGITLKETEARLREAPGWGLAGIIAVIAIKTVVLSEAEAREEEAAEAIAKFVFLIRLIGNGKDIDGVIKMIAELVHGVLIND